MKDLFALVLFVIFFAWFLFYIPNYLGHADNYIPADPLVTPPHIVPEWYFLPFYAILRAIPSKLGGVIAMFGSILVLFALPWLDRSAVRSASFRPIYRQFFWVFVVVCILLGYLGSQSPDGTTLGMGNVFLARVLTFYYFAFFLILMPILGVVETTRPLPPSITESVLKKQKHGATAMGVARQPGGAPEAAE
jgi:ubiquinol-cytochrome c reductase cytochrome b subunit